MGKLTQDWQADDGQFFETEEQMWDHELDVKSAKLSKSWESFVLSRADGYDVEFNFDLSETDTTEIEDVIEYLKRELENRPK